MGSVTNRHGFFKPAVAETGWGGTGVGTSVAANFDLLEDLILRDLKVDFDAAGNGTSDDSAEVQAAVDSIDAGKAGIIMVPEGRYKCNSAINVGTRRIRFVGAGTMAYNPVDGLATGSVFETGTNAMTLFNIDGGGGSANSGGPSFEGCVFYDTAQDSRLMYWKNTNFCHLRSCTFGSDSRLNGTTGIELDYGTNDCAWHEIYGIGLHRLETGIKATKTYGFNMWGGNIIGCEIGVDLTALSSVCSLWGVKGDGGNPCIRSLGTLNEIHGFKWEVTDAGATAYKAILLDGGVSPSGRKNHIFGAELSGASGTNTWGLDITSAATHSACWGISTQGFASGQGVRNQSTSVRVSRGDQGETTGVGWEDFGGIKLYTGTGSPESVITANIGSLYLRRDGSTSTTLYVKTSGSGNNTGWTAK